MEHQLISVLLPYLSKLAQGTAPLAGATEWEQAQTIWQKLKPGLEAKAAGQEALSDLLSDLDDEDYQAALRVQIKKLLKQDAALQRELELLLQKSGQALGGVQINQKVSGSGNQVIGQVTGGMVFGNVSGGNVVIGPGAGNAAGEQSSNVPAAKAEAAEKVVKTILVLTANPKGSDPLRLAEEVREIGEALTRSSQRESFKIVQRSAVRTEDLRRALLEHEPYLVHFSGHGVGQEGAGLGSVAGQRKIGRVPAEGAEAKQGPEGIVLEDVVGQPKLVSGEALAALFGLFAASMEVVVLNSCYSAVQAEEIGKSIPVVVGMRRAIGDRAAIEFAKGFYDALFSGRAVKDSFDFGVNNIQLEGIPEALTPVFQSR